MSESVTLPWMVVRQDEDGGRYRVGRYATLWEARALAERLSTRGTPADATASTSAGTRTAPSAAVMAHRDGGRIGARRAGEGEDEGDVVVERTRGLRYLVERTDHPGGSEG